jgi:GNAT superfamily N-acetyltransferase
MEIIDLNSQYEKTWLNCFEDWSEEMAQAGDGKSLWYAKTKDKGLRVKLAIENDKAVGMIQYIPIEQSHVEGKNLYFVYCIWVHGYKEGVGNHQRKGIGTELLNAAEEDVKALGADGLAAWGLAIPVWMKSSWYRKRGFKVADRDGISHLVWKPFTPDAVKPQWIKGRRKPENRKDKVLVTALTNGWCQVQNINKECARRAADRFGDKVEYREIDTTDKVVVRHWGRSEGIYIDNKLISTGPPLKEDKIAKRISKQLKRKKL